MSKQYRVKEEYQDRWFNGESDPGAVIDELEVVSLAYEWDVPMTELLTQLVEV